MLLTTKTKEFLESPKLNLFQIKDYIKDYFTLASILTKWWPILISRWKPSVRCLRTHRILASRRSCTSSSPHRPWSPPCWVTRRTTLSRPCPWVCPCSTSPTPAAQFQVLLRVLGHCRISTRTSVRCPPSCPQWMSTKVLRAALLQMKDRTTVLMMKYLIFIFLN